jgi:cell division cycle protein 37
VFEVDSPPLPTYSKMIATILDEANRKLEDRHIEKDRRYEALIEELGTQLRKLQDLQTDLVKKLDKLEGQDSMKITSESYHVGFDSSCVNKTKQVEKPKENTRLELLNPNYNSDKANSDTSTKAIADSLEDGDERVRVSPAAKKFAHIKATDYHASYEYISSHREILRESETDGLLIEAYHAILNQSDDARAWQCVHQALLLQCCRMLGRDGVALFFKRIATPGHQARELFEKDVAEKFQQIREMARRDAKQRSAAGGGGAVEQIQLHPVEENMSIRIQVPPAESEDKEVRKARAIFEGFAPEMRAALESGSLDEVNKVLGTMDVPEAENLVGLLGDVSPFRVPCAGGSPPAD